MNFIFENLIENPEYTEYFRIERGLELSSNNFPYNYEYINYLLVFFEREEDYYKCDILLKKLELLKEIDQHQKLYNISHSDSIYHDVTCFSFY